MVDAGAASTSLFIVPGHRFRVGRRRSSPTSICRSRRCCCSSAPSPGASACSPPTAMPCVERYRFYSYGDAMADALSPRRREGTAPAGTCRHPRHPDETPVRRIRPERCADLSARVAQEQGARRGLRAAVSAGQRHPGLLASLPAALAAGDFKAVVTRARRCATSGRGDRLGPRRARVEDRAVADPRRSDGARLRVGARDQRRRSSFTTSRSRSAGATSEDVDEALGPGRFGMAEETATLLNAAITDGVAEGLGIGQAVGRFLARRATRRMRATASPPRPGGSAFR